MCNQLGGNISKKNLCSYLACSSNQASSMTDGSSVRGGGNVDVVVDLLHLVTVCLNLSSVFMMNRTIKKNFHYTYSVCTIRILLDSVNDWFYLLLSTLAYLVTMSSFLVASTNLWRRSTTLLPKTPLNILILPENYLVPLDDDLVFVADASSLAPRRTLSSSASFSFLGFSPPGTCHWCDGRRLVLRLLLDDEQANVVDHTVLVFVGLFGRKNTFLGRS